MRLSFGQALGDLWYALAGGTPPNPPSTLLNDLVSYWPLDEPQGTRYDVVGTNHLTSNNGVLGGPVSRLGAASFVAANSEYLTASDNAGVSIAGDKTISLWLKPANATGYRSVIGSPAIWVYQNPTTNTFDFQLTDGSSPVIVTSDDSIAANAWGLFTLTYTASDKKLRLTINGGTPKATAALGGNPLDNGSPFAFGVNNTYNNYWYDGNMCAAGIWDRVLSGVEVTTLYNSGRSALVYADLDAGLKTGLVSWWDLSEGAGTRYDSHGTNHLTDNNTVGYTRPNGVRKAAPMFVAANSEFLNKASVSTAVDPPMTISFWFKPTSVAGVSEMFSLGAGGNFIVRANGAYYQLVTRGFSDGNYFTGAPNFVAGGWYYCLAWNDPDNNQYGMALNGIEHTFVRGGARGAGTDVFVGARDATPTSPTDGEVATLGYWSRVLTSDERTALFNKGSYALDYSQLTDGIKTGLVSWWDLDEASGTRYDKVGTNHLTDNNTVMSAEGNGLATENAAQFISASSQFIGDPTLSPATMPQLNEYSFSMWFNTDGYQDAFGLIGYDYMSATVYTRPGQTYLNMTAYNTTDGWMNAGMGWDYARETLGWHNVVWRYSIGIMDVWLDGIRLVTNIASPTAAPFYGNYPTAGKAFVRIGQRGDGYNFAQGKIDEVAVWSRVLTADEITELYAAGRGKFYPF